MARSEVDAGDDAEDDVEDKAHGDARAGGDGEEVDEVRHGLLGRAALTLLRLLEGAGDALGEALAVGVLLLLVGLLVVGIEVAHPQWARAASCAWRLPVAGNAKGAQSSAV